MLQQTDREVRLEKELEIITERVDDIPFIIGVMKRTGLPEILDHHIPTYWLQRDLSWGWTSVIWLGYVLSEGDHRKVSVSEYIKGMKNTLSDLSGQKTDEKDFADDRLTVVLKYLSKNEYWEKIEKELNERTITAYELPTEVVRCDATTISGHHEVTEEGLFQYGHSKDNPKLPQIKMMTGSLDPLGMPLASDIVSGERADDVLYVPVIERIARLLPGREILYVGDCKMSASNIRERIVETGGHYLCPLPRIGTIPEKLDKWAEEGAEAERKEELIPVCVRNEKGEDTVIAKGYERKRQVTVGGDEESSEEREERVLIVKSLSHAKQQEAGLEKRLGNAEDKIRSLTPPRGRGKRQITDEEQLKAAVEGVLRQHKADGLIEYDYEKETERTTKYVGKGRGGANRKKKVVEKVRYQITAVTRNEDAIEKEKEKFGWKAYVTDVSETRLSFEDAVICYRREYRVERIFSRLKSRLSISPLFVKRDDQVTGLTHLLMLGVRILTLTEYVVRRSLRDDNASLPSLHPENRRKKTDTPTAERLLKAFSGISLTVIKTGNDIIRHLTPLSELQKEILKRAGLDASLYEHLEINKTIF